MGMDVDDEAGLDELAAGAENGAAGAGAMGDVDLSGSKVIVIHPGSQNIRLGLASDALPKSVPMVIARKWPCNESEEGGTEAMPRRAKLEDGSYQQPEKMFGLEVSSDPWMTAMAANYPIVLYGV